VGCHECSTHQLSFDPFLLGSPRGGRIGPVAVSAAGIDSADELAADDAEDAEADDDTRDTGAIPTEAERVVEVGDVNKEVASAAIDTNDDGPVPATGGVTDGMMS